MHEHGNASVHADVEFGNGDPNGRSDPLRREFLERADDASPSVPPHALARGEHEHTPRPAMDDLTASMEACISSPTALSPETFI